MSSLHLTPGYHTHQGDRRRDAQIARDQFEESKRVDKLGQSAFRALKVFAKASDIMTDSIDTRELTTCFSNANQAELFFEMIKNQHSTVDTSVPLNPEKKRALVAVLVRAFKSVGKAQDNQNMLAAFDDELHNNALVEVVCWKLLQCCIERCGTTQPLQTAYGVVGKKTTITNKYETFEKRFDAIVEALSTFKCLCKQLYDPHAMTLLVDDPKARLHKTQSNKVGNATKGKALKKAKESKQTVMTRDHGENEDTAIEQPAQVQPSKRPREDDDG